MKISKSIKIEAHILFQLPEAYISISLVIPVRTSGTQVTFKKTESTGSTLKKMEVLQKYFVTRQLMEVSTVNNSFLQFWLCVEEQGRRGKPYSLVFEPEEKKNIEK